MRDSHAFPDLAQGFRGQLVSPFDAAYDRDAPTLLMSSRQ